MLKRGLCAGGLMLMTAAFARAHDPGLSTITLQRLPQRVEFSVVLNHADLPSQREASSAACDAQGVLAAWLDGRSLPVQARCRLQDEEHTAFEGELALPRGGSLEVQLALFDELPRGHRSYARLLDPNGSPEAQRLLTHGNSPLRAQLATPPRWSVLTLGPQHILAGTDHLLFLAVLLFGAEGLRRMLALASTFTLAYTLTLALASFGWLAVSSRWVEIAIAVSIVWVAVRNFIARVPQSERLAAALGFGLIHGLG